MCRGNREADFVHASRRELSLFMREAFDAVPESAVAEQTETLYRLSNVHLYHAIENGIRAGMGKPIAAFVPERRPVALLLGQERYFERALDGAGQPTGPERPWIHDANAGEKFLELPQLYYDTGEPYRPTLHCTPDRGPVGFGAYCFMYEEVGVRGFLFWDIWHILQGNLENAIKWAGEWIIVLEFLIVFNAMQGVWDDQASFQKVCREAQFLQENETWRLEVFQALYPRICAESEPCLLHDVDYGTEEHMERVWEGLWGRKCFRGALTRVQTRSVQI